MSARIQYNNMPTCAPVVIRPGHAGDVEAIRRIQEAAPEAAQWDPASYLSYNLLVAEVDQRLAGFLVTRLVAPSESEVLNLAVEPEFRRRGVARALVSASTTDRNGTVFLEVRESNAAARSLYKSMGFHDVSRRSQYYDHPPEAAIVMKFHSC